MCEIKGLEATVWMTFRDISKQPFYFLLIFKLERSSMGLVGPRKALGQRLSPGEGAGRLAVSPEDRSQAS